MLKVLIFIGFGSFLGGVARYALGRLVASVAGFPSFLGTFAANVLGCLLIGVLYGLFERYDVLDNHWRLFLTVGFCGGVYENYTSFSDGRFLMAAAYATGSFALGLLMVYLGHLVAKP